jgi:hypothetical protein
MKAENSLILRTLKWRQHNARNGLNGGILERAMDLLGRMLKCGIDLIDADWMRSAKTYS